jgi:PPM family protein phosphatase
VATVTNGRSTMEQLGTFLGRLWSGRPRFGHRMMVRVVAASDVGTMRRSNEDYFLVSDLVRPVTATHGNDVLGDTLAAEPLLVVADGMGGAAGGEVASGMAATVIWSELARAVRARRMSTPPRRRRSLLDAFGVANERIRACAATSPELVGMGTTATAAVLARSELYVAHVGDTRAYLVRDGRAQRLTKDHSVLQYLIDSGAADAVETGQGHALLRALGPEADVTVDVVRVPLRPDDVVVLCSDGVWSAVDDDEIAAVASARTALRVACETLIALANERGGRDNATAVVARFEPAASVS